MTIETTDYEGVVQAISQWPVDKRFSLVQEVLQSLAPPVPSPQRKRTLQQALGIAATGRPAPTDEEVKQWIEEFRMEKYG